MVHVYSSSLAKDLGAQSGLKFSLKLHLLLWPLGFAYFSRQKFSRISIRNALWFAVYDNLPSVCKRHQSQQSFVVVAIFQVKRGASMWSSNLVEVAMKFGVLLAVPRNETRKNPRNPASCSVLIGAFDAKLINKYKCIFLYLLFWIWRFKFLSWFVPYYTSLYIVGFTFTTIDLPEEKFKMNNAARILPREIPYVTLGLILLGRWLNYLHQNQPKNMFHIVCTY